MEIPLFSWFSAISEMFVTLGVLYGIITCLRGNPLPKKLLGAVLIFEFTINVVYMAKMAGKADSSSELSAAMKAFFAAHGILSLLMFIAIAATYLLALADEMKGRPNWFYRNKVWSYVLIFFWILSVGSGEVMFYLRYLAPGA